MDASMFASLGVIKEANKSIFRESPASSRRAKSLKATKSFKSLTPLLSRKNQDEDSRVTMRHSASPTIASERPFLSRISSTNTTLDLFESFDQSCTSSTATFRSVSSEGVSEIHCFEQPFLLYLIITSLNLLPKETTPTNSDPGVEEEDSGTPNTDKFTAVDSTAVTNKLLNMISLPQVMRAQGKTSIVSANI
jgi:hypothetical protein